MRMGQKMKIAGWVSVGVLAGALTTVSLQTVARGAMTPLPLEETSSSRLSLAWSRPTTSSRWTTKTHHRRHLWHGGHSLDPHHSISTRSRLPNSARHIVSSWAWALKSQDGLIKVVSPIEGPFPRRAQDQRPDHQDRRHRRQGPVAGRCGRSWRARHRRAHHLPQGRKPQLPGDHHPRGNQTSSPSRPG